MQEGLPVNFPGSKTGRRFIVDKRQESGIMISVSLPLLPDKKRKSKPAGNFNRQNRRSAGEARSPIGGSNVSDQNHNSSLYENSEYPSRRRAPRQTERQGEGKKRPRKKRRGGSAASTVFKVLGTLLLVGLCTGAILCCFTAVYIKTVISPIADLSTDDFQMGENSIMYYQDRQTGEYKELVTLLNTTSSIWVDYDEIPQNLIDAAVAIEDKRFWTHPGVDWRRTANAVLSMFTGGDISGGSTITQQLIKNQTGYNETTVKRKITEIVRALRFTQNNSKEATITWYLNIIPLGSGCEGVGSAAYEYFGKPVSELSLAECASLISITNNPSKYGPYSDSRVASPDGSEMWTAKQWNKYRQEVVLYQMLDQKYITQEEYDQAVAEELVWDKETGEVQDQDIYSWYEETVIADVKRGLKEKYKVSDKRAEQLLASGGLRIYTCLDPKVQTIAESVYTNRENLDYTSKDGQLMQSAITIVDNSTGDIVAVVGQFGQKTGNLWSNFATESRRQPGSSFKPLAVYSPALELGLISPITIIDDYPYNDSNGSGWPINSGAAKYKGLTTVRNGLMNSVNTIAVRILADHVTVPESFSFVQDKYKIELVDALQVGNQIMSDLDVAPLSMGGLTKGVTTREMAQAYATFANNGVYTYGRTYTQVLDVNGNVILENESARELVIKDTTAYYMNSMLQGVVNSGTGTRAKISGMTVAGKTGTTSENYDRWFVGYTPYYTAAVWTGYPQNAKMRTEGNPAVNLWQKVMSQVHEGLENKAFLKPNGLGTVNYCLDSGMRATEYCAMDPRGSRVGSDSVFQSDAPSGPCTVHSAESVITVCTDSPILKDDGSETGLYHIAGPYCPAESLKEICLPNYEREQIGTAVAQDEIYRLSAVEAYGPCTVHTEAPVVEPPEIVDPPDPYDPMNPWAPVDPVDPTDPSDPNGSGSGSGGSGSGGGNGEEPPPAQDIRW